MTEKFALNLVRQKRAWKVLLEEKELTFTDNVSHRGYLVCSVNPDIIDKISY